MGQDGTLGSLPVCHQLREKNPTVPALSPLDPPITCWSFLWGHGNASTQSTGPCTLGHWRPPWLLKLWPVCFFGKFSNRLPLIMILFYVLAFTASALFLDSSLQTLSCNFPMTVLPAVTAHNLRDRRAVGETSDSPRLPVYWYSSRKQINGIPCYSIIIPSKTIIFYHYV